METIGWEPFVHWFQDVDVSFRNWWQSTGCGGVPLWKLPTIRSHTIEHQVNDGLQSGDQNQNEDTNEGNNGQKLLKCIHCWQALFVVSVMTAKPVFVLSVLTAKPIFINSV